MPPIPVPFHPPCAYPGVTCTSEKSTALSLQTFFKSSSSCPSFAIAAHSNSALRPLLRSLATMTQSHKKVTGVAARPVDRLVVQTARSSSSKKASSSRGSSTERPALATSRTSSSRKKPSWDDTTHDLSVHRLPRQKMIEKQLQMMSKEALCRIAGIEPPVRATTTRERSVPRGTGRPSFGSPSSNSSASSSAASTPETSHGSSSEADDSSVGSTPSPEARRPAATVTSRPSLAARAKKAATVPAQEQVAPIIIAPTIARRRSAAPTTTTAPPPPPAQEEDEDFSSSYAYNPSSSLSSSTASTELSYSPWLKQDQLLSPVLERSIEASTIAASPDARFQQQPNERQHDPIRSPSPVHEHESHGGFEDISSPAHDAQGRNLLHELRQSIDASRSQPSHEWSAAARDAHLDPSTRLDLEQQAIGYASVAQLAPLLTRLADHLSERPERAAKEGAFKATVVDSFAKAATQVKELVARVADAEREVKHMREAMARQQAEHQRANEQMERQMRAMEMRIDQIAMGRAMPTQMQMQPQMQAPVPMPVPMPSPAPTAYAPPAASLSPYDPSAYHSVHSAHRPSPSPVHAFDAPLPHAAPAPSSIARAPSPPRPIVIGHAPRATVHGQRMSEVSVQLTGAHSQQQPRMTHSNQAPIPAAQTQHRPTQQAWSAQTQQSHSSQQQHQQMRPSMPVSSHHPPAQHHAPFPTAPSSHAYASSPAPRSLPPSHALDDEFDSDSSLSVDAPDVRAAPLRSHVETPLSPGEAEEAAEAARFAREAATARERLAKMGGGVYQPPPPMHAQQPHPQRTHAMPPRSASGPVGRERYGS